MSGGLPPWSVTVLAAAFAVAIAALAVVAVFRLP